MRKKNPTISNINDNSQVLLLAPKNKIARASFLIHHFPEILRKLNINEKFNVEVVVTANTGLKFPECNAAIANCCPEQWVG